MTDDRIQDHAAFANAITIAQRRAELAVIERIAALAPEMSPSDAAAALRALVETEVARDMASKAAG